MPAKLYFAALFDADPTPTLIQRDSDTFVYHNAAGLECLQKKYINTAQHADDEIKLFSQLSSAAQKIFFEEQILPTLDLVNLLRSCDVKPLSFSFKGQLFQRYSLPPTQTDIEKLEMEMKTMLLTSLHDNRNLLGIIRNQIHLLQFREDSLSNDAVERLQKIDAAAKTAAAIAEKMTTFHAMHVPVQDCNILLRAANVILTGIVPVEMQLQIETWPEPLPVKLTQGGLNNALVNLVLNAVEASQDGNTIRIKCAEQLHHQLGRSVCVTVYDNGCGIDDSRKQFVRNAFYSQKTDPQLHGMGLLSVQEFVSDAGGVVDIADNSPSGTKISLFLPWVKNE